MGEDLAGEEDWSLRTSMVVTTDKESKVRPEYGRSVKDEDDEDEVARDEEKKLYKDSNEKG